MPAQGTDEHVVVVRRLVDNLVRSYVSTHTVIQQLEVRAETVQTSVERRRSGSSGVNQRRKQPTPRHAVPSEPSTSQDSSGPVSISEQPQRAEEEQEQITALPNPKELLLGLPGITATRIPQTLVQQARTVLACQPTM